MKERNEMDETMFGAKVWHSASYYELYNSGNETDIERDVKNCSQNHDILLESKIQLRF